MKKCVIWTLLFFGGFSLAARLHAEGFSVYVPEISGRGREPDDNALFLDTLTRELIGRNYSLVKNRDSADYTLEGTLSPLPGAAPSQNAQTRFFSFRLVLSENSSGQNLAEQTLIYSVRKELDNLLPMAVSGIFSGISVSAKPPENVRENGGRDKMWYFGAAAFWTPRIYSRTSQSINLTNFGAAFLAEFHFLDFLSLETGAAAAPDWVAVSGRSGDSYWDTVLEIPLVLKLVLKPGASFMIEPYAGVNFNISMYGAIKPALLSWRAGLQYGIKAGPGVFFLEPRFSMDFGDSLLETRTGRMLDYQRYIIHFGAGYKFGVKDRK